MLGKLIFIALSAYFTMKIVQSVKKFEHQEHKSHPFLKFIRKSFYDCYKSERYILRQIYWDVVCMYAQLVGISSSMENSKLIMYPSITICAFRRSTSKYFANVPYPWFYHQGTSGPTPDLNKILDSLSYHSHINNSRSDVCSITCYHI